jgi:GTPase SAR1 family protein
MGASGFKNERQQVLLLGLEKSGKTAFLKKLKDIKDKKGSNESKLDLGEDNNDVDPKGFNLLEINNLNEGSYEIWDLGGDATTRQYWSTFYRKIQFNIVIFFIDLFNEKSHISALKELLILVNEEELKFARFFIIFNLICDEKNKLLFNEKYNEWKLLAESKMEELRECPIHDYESRVDWGLFDISNLKDGENKTNELLGKCLGTNRDSKLAKG